MVKRVKKAKKEDGYVLDDFVVPEDDSLSEISEAGSEPDVAESKPTRALFRVRNPAKENRLQALKDLDDLLGPASDDGHSDGNGIPFNASDDSGDDSQYDAHLEKQEKQPKRRTTKPAKRSAPVAVAETASLHSPAQALKTPGVKRARSHTPMPGSNMTLPYLLTPPETPAVKRTRTQNDSTERVKGSTQPMPIIHSEELRSKGNSVYKDLLDTFGIGKIRK